MDGSGSTSNVARDFALYFIIDNERICLRHTVVSFSIARRLTLIFEARKISLFSQFGERCRLADETAVPEGLNWYHIILRSHPHSLSFRLINIARVRLYCSEYTYM
jgi:hypothetical protein